MVYRKTKLRDEVAALQERQLLIKETIESAVTLGDQMEARCTALAVRVAKQKSRQKPKMPSTVQMRALVRKQKSRQKPKMPSAVQVRALVRKQKSRQKPKIPSTVQVRAHWYAKKIGIHIPGMEQSQIMMTGIGRMRWNRLPFNPAQDASDWRWPRGVHEEEDGSPRCLDDDDAGTTLENPDIRVPLRTKREDGLQAAVEEKDAEEPGSEENDGNTADQEKKADDDRRNGNRVVPREAAGPGRKGRNGDTPTDRHAPGGTCLTKTFALIYLPSSTYSAIQEILGKELLYCESRSAMELPSFRASTQGFRAPI
ncbi:hypothetical protein NDU88_001297 [Pleurodeles waltl]|uniref:Uncharacterized protein n=1 Tax=Pleurodeles waltl TaxID=8319 RepID=A0AAV7MJB3_PLEWA|nr:hypothetical protein NDU88_001297 [Pleurodeles waltl]